jgi:hypothetical protein
MRSLNPSSCFARCNFGAGPVFRKSFKTCTQGKYAIRSGAQRCFLTSISRGVPMTSIEDPFQLSSYTSSSSRWKGKKSSLDHVYISQLNSSLTKSRKEGYVTVATQADGVHLVDVRPSISNPSCSGILVNRRNRSRLSTLSSLIP